MYCIYDVYMMYLYAERSAPTSEGAGALVLYDVFF